MKFLFLVDESEIEGRDSEASSQSTHNDYTIVTSIEYHGQKNGHRWIRRLNNNGLEGLERGAAHVQLESWFPPSLPNCLTLWSPICMSTSVCLLPSLRVATRSLVFFIYVIHVNISDLTCCVVWQVLPTCVMCSVLSISPNSFEIVSFTMWGFPQSVKCYIYLVYLNYLQRIKYKYLGEIKSAEDTFVYGICYVDSKKKISVQMINIRIRCL